MPAMKRRWIFVAAAVLAVLAGLLGTQLLRDDSDTAGQPTRKPTSTATPEVTDTGSSATATPGTPSSAATPTSDGIELAWSSDFARPFETVRIAGEYPGAAAGTILRVQLQQGGGWTAFPLRVATREEGRFQAFVELGEPGVYRLRVVDPQTETVSDTLTLTIF